MDIIYSVILWIVFLQLFACDVNGAVIRERTQYTRDVLLQLNMATAAKTEVEEGNKVRCAGTDSFLSGLFGARETHSEDPHVREEDWKQRD
ncbi:putative glycosyltransferase 48 [Dissostichus eleginoides]|uniref:Glycosyltransferase 48 n=1 Tax=Dissostichus eleginoides TaxID=100907 RepID=A0AAD9CE65_DISEL|nr:putative glycosyltransferase 48 [Dissostichus eleginoides]